MDLSFKEKKTVCNFVVWFLKYQAKRKVVIFFGTPCINCWSNLMSKCIALLYIRVIFDFEIIMTMIAVMTIMFVIAMLAKIVAA